MSATPVDIKVSHRPTRWLNVASDLKKDAPFFISLGFVCGVMQIFGYRYFDKADWGTTLLEEHVAPFSLMILVATVCLIRSVQEYYHVERVGFLQQLVEHLCNRAACLGSVAACAVFGFALSAVAFGSLWHASKFIQASIYLASLAELATNSPAYPNSRFYYFAWGTVVITPFAY